ncbi:helix-turn-helix transcriptional regulator [Arthrobacter sp. A5]|uniref:helix-turn-helix transcriptional regulator n=1 Tax=Arthrobacter sp. A5 TaxID=576926 RepID=UPI003DA83C35
MSAARSELSAQPALSSPSRVRLLAAIRGAVQPPTAAELAERSGLQLSTVRFHLKTLVHAALIEPVRDFPNGPGRPQLRYRAFHREPDSGGYRLLAEILAESLTDRSANTPQAKAQAAGARWMRGRMDRPAGPPQPDAGTVPQEPPAGAVDQQQAAEAVGALLAELGFEPEPAAAGTESLLHLHACPFVSMARALPEVVCAAHLGLLSGYLEGLGAGRADVRLQPWATADTCVAAISLPGPDSAPQTRDPEPPCIERKQCSS